MFQTFLCQLVAGKLNLHTYPSAPATEDSVTILCHASPSDLTVAVGGAGHSLGDLELCGFV